MAKVHINVSVDYDNLLIAKTKVENISNYVNDCLAALGEKEDLPDEKIKEEIAKTRARLARLENKKIEKEEEDKNTEWYVEAEP